MTRLTLLGLLLAPAWPLAAQQAPAGPPESATIVAPALPRAQEAVLANGLRLILLEQHRQPVLSLTLSVPAGSAFDPPDREGTAEMLAALTTRGGGTRTASQVAAAIEGVGGSLSAAADPDFLTVQADIVSAHAALAFDLIADGLLRPALAADELELLRGQTANALQGGLADPGTLAARIFLIGAYQRFPYARRATPASVAAITREDLLAFHKARVRPAGAILVVVGDITLVEARRLAVKAFGAWKGLKPAPLPVPVKTAPPRGIVLVHVPGSQEASILVGGTTFAGTDTAYYAAAVLNRLIGDERNGRLIRALGREHAWTSATGASFLRTARLGLFQTTAAVPAEVADSALREMYAQLDLLRTELAPARELGRARENVAGGFALRLQSASQLAGGITETSVLGLPASYVAGYRMKVAAITAAQVRAVARRAFPENALVTVVVGDGARLYAPLAKMAPVQLFASDGRPLTAADVEPRTGAMTFELGSVATRTDSLAILAQGQTIGLQVTQLVRSGDSLIYSERTQLGQALNQTTTLTFDTVGRMRHLEQTGVVRGQDTRIRLGYGGGRVRGEVQVVGANGPEHFTVDTAVAATVLDDNAVQAILPLLPWAVNTRWSFQVFVSGENTVRGLTLTAADITQVNTPAGAFECYRADLEGGQQRVSFFVTTARPHRVVRVELANSPVVFIAVNP